jgi:hypothetical protein
MTAALALVLFLQFGDTGLCKARVMYGENQDYVIVLGDFCVFFDSPETIIEPLPLELSADNSDCISGSFRSDDPETIMQPLPLELSSYLPR